ncbi:MAG: glycosyltransferase [Gammaproteobacteria bacterium]
MSTTRLTTALSSTKALNTLEVKHDETRVEIPKVIYFVWFGSMLPDTKLYPYQSNVKSAQRLNPEHEVCLYTDATSMTDKDFTALAAFCAAQRLSFIDLNSAEQRNFANLEHIKFENSLKNFARASDMTRGTILHDRGGIYLDVDLRPKKSFGNMHAPLGILHYIVSDNSDDRFNIYFMAAIPHHPSFAACIRYFDDIYKIIKSTPDHRTWLTTTDQKLCLFVNTYTTGGVYDQIFKFSLHPKEKNYIHFDLEEYITIVCDNSWIKPDQGRDQNAQMNFLNYKTLYDNYTINIFMKMIPDLIVRNKKFERFLFLERTARTEGAKSSYGFLSYRELLKFKLIAKKSNEHISNHTKHIEEVYYAKLDAPVRTF